MSWRTHAGICSRRLKSYSNRLRVHRAAYTIQNTLHNSHVYHRVDTLRPVLLGTVFVWLVYLDIYHFFWRPYMPLCAGGFSLFCVQINPRNCSQRKQQVHFPRTQGQSGGMTSGSRAQGPGSSEFNMFCESFSKLAEGRKVRFNGFFSFFMWLRIYSRFSPYSRYSNVEQPPALKTSPWWLCFGFFSHAMPPTLGSGLSTINMQKMDELWTKYAPPTADIISLAEPHPPEQSGSVQIHLQLNVNSH